MIYCLFSSPLHGYRFVRIYFFCLTFKIQETIFQIDSVLFILLLNQIVAQAMTCPTCSI